MTVPSRDVPPMADAGAPAAGGRRPGVASRTVRALSRRWRESVGVRVITTTLSLSLLVVALLGAYLYGAIGTGLETDRLNQAQAEAQQLTRVAQAKFDSLSATSVNDLYIQAREIVRQNLVLPAPDTSRYVILMRSIDNTNPGVIGVNASPGLTAASVPMDLRTALAKDPKHEQTKFIDIVDPATSRPVTALIVGSRIRITTIGSYDLYFVYPMTREATTLARFARSFSVASVILALLVSLIAWVVTRQVVIPVGRAAAAAERLAAGDLNERLQARGHDELAALGTSFNAMADSLQAQIHQLEGLSRVQQRFVSDVSHELRTPLSTVRMAADLIFDTREDFTAPVARSAELLHAELDRFEELLTDLLEISRFDAGAAVLDLEPTDVRAIVEKVLADNARLAELSGSQVRLEASGPAIADIDGRRVERILRNLFVNALEYGEGQPVVVHVATNDTAVAVVVEDHGVGLRPGEASLVFTRFWRADPARTRTTGGTGLGLAIALEDARLHGGWLQAWGEIGVGSRFRLSLPRHHDIPLGVSPLSLSPERRSLRAELAGS